MSIPELISIPPRIRVGRGLKQNIAGTVIAPPSKSVMQRACAAALLRRGETRLLNPGFSRDDRAALSIIRNLGAEVTEGANFIQIKSAGVSPVASQLDCGESGLSIRMFTPLAALSNQALLISGSGSLTKRPLHFFDEVFPQIGVACTSQQGHLPLQIQGPLTPQSIQVDGSLSSQFLTGLLMAYSVATQEQVCITVDNLKSKPYIDLTLAVMEAFGMSLPKVSDYKTFTFEQGFLPTQPFFTYAVEGDWSGGAFLLVAGAIAGPVEVRGLDAFSKQADKAILQALMSSGARLSIHPDHIMVEPTSLKAFHFNATDCPDLFPPLVALAAHCAGTTVIEGVSRLTHKESNRALTLQSEFGKIGVSIRLQDDLMLVEGCASFRSNTCHSHHDHRIAMALAVVSLGAEICIEIEQADAIAKSYPQFYQDLAQLGCFFENM